MKLNFKYHLDTFTLPHPSIYLQVLCSRFPYFPKYQRMPCSFCREPGHVRSDCIHPNTIQVQQAIIEDITNVYVSGAIYAFTRAEFTNTILIVLDYKYTVNDLKKVHEYLKRRVRTITIEHQTPPHKKTLMTYITALAGVVFSYQFSGLENSPEHVPSPQGLTVGVRAVVRQILRPNVGGLQLRPGVTAPMMYRAAPAVTTPIRDPHPRVAIYTPNYGVPQHPHQTVRIVRRTYTVKKTDKPVEEDSPTCAICFEMLENDTYVYFNCSHQFCKGCVKECIKRDNVKCSLCRAPITEIFTHNPVVHYSL